MPTHTTLKQRFLIAIVSGKLGKQDDRGVIVKLKEFKAYFKKDIKTQYITSFLPAAAIEKGQASASHTKFVFRLSKGVYLVHPDAIDEMIELIIDKHFHGGVNGPVNEDEPKVKEDCECYIC